MYMYIYFHAVKPKNLVHIYKSIIRGVESNSMQNDQAKLSFLGI